MANLINNNPANQPIEKQRLIRHPERWFVNRIGHQVQKVTTGTCTLIKIESKMHAKAMYISQSVSKIKYTEV